MKNKLSVKERMIRHKICLLQKGDWICINGRWRQISFIHGWTICFISYTKTWGRSKLAWYSIHSLWKNVDYVIRESTNKKKLEKCKIHLNEKN